MSDTTLLTVRQTAALLDVHEQTVRAGIKDGRIPATRIPGGWRVPKEILLARIETEALARVGEAEKS